MLRRGPHAGHASRSLAGRTGGGGPLYAHLHRALLGPGVVLATLATWLVWRGQDDMGASWRIGIATGERTELVTWGLFRLCRNPIYLGLPVALAAYCCLLPGYLTGGLLVLGSHSSTSRR